MNARRLLIGALLMLITAPVTAQNPTDITPFVPIQGTITDAPETWTFSALTNEPLSFRVDALSGNLDPLLTIRDRTGATLITNDDYNYPDSGTALLEAVTIPELGTYTATVSAFGGTSGDYRLAMLPGYADAGTRETFDILVGWSAGETGSVASSDQAMRLSLNGEPDRTIAANPDSELLGDFFAQVSVLDIIGNQWAVGMTARQQDSSYYLFLVNDRGEWRFSLNTPDGETVLRDWTRHPAIRAGVRVFTLELMAADSGFDVFYNRNILGHLSDTTLADAGGIGLALEREGTDNLSATFDNLVTTIPVQVSGDRLIPQQLVLGTPQFMVQGLQRQRMISANGELTLNVAQSFTEFSRAGVNVLPLASGLTFSNLAIGATVYLSSATATPGGCGLAFRMTDTQTYTLAYLDGSGGYGLSERAGDTFSAGLYGQDPNWTREAHHLLVIADGNTLHYYVDGRYAGTLENPKVEGGVGNAVVNFNTVYTSCQFVNTWLWQWDS